MNWQVELALKAGDAKTQTHNRCKNCTSTSKHCNAIRHEKKISIQGETWIAAQLVSCHSIYKSLKESVW